MAVGINDFLCLKKLQETYTLYCPEVCVRCIDNCSMCMRVRDLLKELNISYTEFDTIVGEGVFLYKRAILELYGNVNSVIGLVRCCINMNRFLYQGKDIINYLKNKKLGR